MFGTGLIHGWWYKLISKTSLLNLSFYSKLWTLNLDITCFRMIFYVYPNQRRLQVMLNRISPQSGIHGLADLESRSKTDIGDECWLLRLSFWWHEIFEVGIFLMTKRIIRDESIPIFELGSNKFHHLKQLLNLELLETCCQLSFGLI